MKSDQSAKIMQPHFSEPLHVGSPNIGDHAALMQRFEEILQRRRLTNRGPFVRELESKLAAFLGVKHCIAMCNGTIALEIAIRALGLSGEVIIPSFTFIATAHALQWQQVTPVFCDVEPQRFTIDPGKIEAMITPRTTGIIGVHLWGRVCETQAIEEIAAKHQLQVLYDASHAFANASRGTMVGNFGRAEVFSFHATKFFNCFEGGAVATNDDDLAAKIRLMQNFGFAGMDQVIYIGTNGKMNEAQAAMGLTSLEGIDQFIATNLQNYRQYERELSGIPGLRLLPYSGDAHYNYQYVTLEIDSEAFGHSRDALMHFLRSHNVLARRYFYPGCHQMEPYKSLFPHSGLLLPVTEDACERVLCLPTGTAIDATQICQIVTLIREFHQTQNAPRNRYKQAFETAH